MIAWRRRRSRRPQPLGELVAERARRASAPGAGARAERRSPTKLLPPYEPNLHPAIRPTTKARTIRTRQRAASRADPAAPKTYRACLALAERLDVPALTADRNGSRQTLCLRYD